MISIRSAEITENQNKYSGFVTLVGMYAYKNYALLTSVVIPDFSNDNWFGNILANNKVN